MSRAHHLTCGNLKNPTRHKTAAKTYVPGTCALERTNSEEQTHTWNCSRKLSRSPLRVWYSAYITLSRCFAASACSRALPICTKEKKTRCHVNLHGMHHVTQAAHPIYRHIKHHATNAFALQVSHARATSHHAHTCCAHDGTAQHVLINEKTGDLSKKKMFDARLLCELSVLELELPLPPLQLLPLPPTHPQKVKALELR